MGEGERADGQGRAAVSGLDAIIAAIGARFRVVTGPGWVLVHGDCLDVLPLIADRSVRVTLTDPPYEAEAHEKGKRQGPAFTGSDYERGDTTRPSKRVVDDVLTFAPMTEDDRSAVAAHIARVTEYRAALFCQVEAIAAWKAALDTGGMPYRRAIPWVKPDAMPCLHGRWPGQSVEAVAFAQHSGAPACPVGGKARYYEATRTPMARDDRAHPTVKPLPLMLAMVDDFTERGDLVLDCYAGSATTGIACAVRGRLFVGIERDPDFFEVAVRRMRGDLARPRPEQPGLFTRPETP